MFWWPIRRCRIPRTIGSLVTVRPGVEVDPRQVGADPAGVDRIWQAAENVYRTGMHPAITLCVRRHGQVLIDRAIGHVRGNGPDDPEDAPKVLAKPDTPFGMLSATKAVTAMVIHLLDQRNMLRLDDPVCEYIPEFGVRSKRWVTIRHVLTHRAGLPSTPAGAMDLDLLADPDRILALLCEAPLTSRPGRQLAYHAVTGGFILGEVVRRVTGQDIRTVHDAAIRAPLGLRWLRYGIEPSDLDQVAENVFTGLPPLPPLSYLLQRALGVEFTEAARLSNDPRFLCGVVPAASMVASANELCRFYQLLLNGGELDGVRIFEPRTIRRATTEHSYLEFDFTLGVPLRYSMGFMLGGHYLSFYGPDTPRAFGHLGFTNVVAWADPERQVTAAFMNSGKPLFYPGLYYIFQMLGEISAACPKVDSA